MKRYIFLALMVCVEVFGAENYLREGILAYNQKAYAQAQTFFELAIQRENSANAAYMLGKMYLYGEGVTVNYDRAIELLDFARENGNIPAGCYLSEAYMDARKNTSYIAYGLMKGLKQHLPHCEKMLTRYKAFTHF